MYIFILALSEIPTSLKQNIYLDQWNKIKVQKQGNIKTYCDFSELLAH